MPAQLLPLAVLTIAYLLGSIPFSFLVVRLFAREDIRTHGSGNVGATNVMRNFGKLPGLLALVLDLGKGYAAVAIAQHLVASKMWPFRYEQGADLMHSPSFWIGFASFLAVIAHMYPVWLGFHGGKGVATAAGVFLALDPRALLAGLIVFAIVLLIWRYVSLASMLAAASLPVWFRFISHSPMWITLFAIAISVAVILKHHANIARLADGTERKFPR
jgi:glycerol-3-phosphate acyltransferase PlsY